VDRTVCGGVLALLQHGQLRTGMWRRSCWGWAYTCSACIRSP
jgi:hypothetical protein